MRLFQIKYLKKDLCNLIILIVFFVISLIVIDTMNNSIIHFYVITMDFIVCIIISRMNVLHPCFWFSGFFYLYHAAYLILFILFEKDTLVKGYSSEYSILCIVALFSTVLFSGIKDDNHTGVKRCDEKTKAGLLRIIEPIWMIIIIGLSSMTLLLSRQGFTHKTQLWGSHNIYWILAVYCTRFITYIISLYLIIDYSKRKFKIYLFVSVVITFFFSILSGERDAMFRLVLAIGISLMYTGKISKKKFIFLIPIGIVFMVFMTAFKYYLSTGTIDTNYLNSGSLLYLFLYSDFAVTGSNLQVLINASSMKGYFGYWVILTDIAGAIVPSSVLNRIFGSETAYNTSQWFNDYFYHGSTWSRDFTLVGEGYVIGGIAGVAILFIIMGLVIKCLRLKSDKSIFWTATYIYGIITIASAFRDSFSTVVSSLVRIPLIMMIFIWIYRNLMHNKKT